MASGEILIKLRNIYAKMDTEVSQWAGIHVRKDIKLIDVEYWGLTRERLLSTLGTISNVLARIPVLKDPQNYSQTFDHIPDFPSKLYQTQAVSLEHLLQQLQTYLIEMSRSVQKMHKLFKDAHQIKQQDKRLTPTSCSVRAGPVPSFDDCLQGLNDIWEMHATEFQLQQALVSEVRYDCSDNDVQEVMAASAARVNVNQARVKELLYVVAATAEAVKR